MASKYQKRHYEDVAQLIRDVFEAAEDSSHDTEGIYSVAHAFANGLFPADNPLFDRDRFLSACGLEGVE